MRSILLSLSFITLLLAGAFVSGASAQGGWRQWEIHMRDGSIILATPLSAINDNNLYHRVKNDDRPADAIKRSKIDYIAALRINDPPPAPTGTVTKDLVVLLNGTKRNGRVTLKKDRMV